MRNEGLGINRPASFNSSFLIQLLSKMVMQRIEYKEWHSNILASATCQNQLPRNPRQLPLLEGKILQGLAILISILVKQIIERVCVNFAHTDDRHTIDAKKVLLSSCIKNNLINLEQWNEKFLIPNS